MNPKNKIIIIIGIFLAIVIIIASLFFILNNKNVDSPVCTQPLPDSVIKQLNTSYENFEISSSKCYQHFSFETPADYSKFEVIYLVEQNDIWLNLTIVIDKGSQNYTRGFNFEQYDLKLKQAINEVEGCVNFSIYAQLSEEVRNLPDSKYVNMHTRLGEYTNLAYLPGEDKENICNRINSNIKHLENIRDGKVTYLEMETK